MSSDSDQLLSMSTVAENDMAMDCQSQVRLKQTEEGLQLILPSVEDMSDANWSDLWQQFKHRYHGGDRVSSGSGTVHLMAGNQLLDGLKLQAITDVLNDVGLRISRVYTSRRQTAVAAATAGYCVEQQSATYSLHQPSEPTQELAEPLYLQMTVRSGVEIRHPGTIVILGDLNPGGTVIAAGDIFIWGSLRGVAHAGADGNRSCRIMALKMEPTQLRIADAVARAPETPPIEFYPEVAYVTPQGIRIARAADFAKTQLLLNS